MNEEKIKRIIADMTLDEKAGLCSGIDFWRTKEIKRLGVPSIVMSDGPHGLRKQAGGSDHVGINKSVAATCFPTASALACSWDRELIQMVGSTIGIECQAEGVSVILGPGANIKRSPLCGRNFEYLSEDPFLSSEMASAYISGVQSQGVGVSLKHFAVNNQETRRMTVDAIVDERTLREIYLASFEGAVKKSRPWTLMAAYNMINGTYCTENRYLLSDILRDEWGFDGLVVSDWGAVNDRVAGVSAGMEMEMPATNGERDNKIIRAVKEGTLSQSVLDTAVERLLRIIFMADANKKSDVQADKRAHHKIARKVACESIVLLKNEDKILPLKKQGTIAIIGGFAKHPRFQGGGSSHVNAAFVDEPCREIEKALSGKDVQLRYAQGYRMDADDGILNTRDLVSVSDEPDVTLIDEAMKVAQSADVAVVFTGLPDSYESEGADRKHLRMPNGHCALVEAITSVQQNVVVVLCNGAPIEMPWLGNVKGLLAGHLGGQAIGGAISDVMFGDVNPCAKLAETYPERLCDNPSYLFFPGEKDKVTYSEGIYVGYRYYEKKEIDPLFPFGFGLSYTQFEYSDIRVDKACIDDDDVLTISAIIENTGDVFGKEIVQLYVRDVKSSVSRPLKELKGFEKVALKPGKRKKVMFTLNKRAFAYYSSELRDWQVESGAFEILIGRSSQDILLKETIEVVALKDVNKTKFTENSTLNDILEYSEKAVKIAPAFSGLMEMCGCNRIEDLPLVFRDMPLRGALVFSTQPFSYKTLGSILENLNSNM